MRPRRLATCFAAAILAVMTSNHAAAWGPHPEITRWALRQLPASDRAEQRLGGLRQMDDLCWGGDYQHTVHADYYVDDFLLFPRFPRHSSHLLPEVRETWTPFFQRTLQALRGESPRNAARWLGAYLHFVQDSGSPPHALPTGGPLHVRMENYIRNVEVRLTGYAPRQPPSDDDAAVAALHARLEGLVAFSRERAERLRPLAEADDRLACEPLELECALETLRVTADVTHALLMRSAAGPRPGTATLTARITAPADADFPLAPTKVMIAGTGVSTIADPLPIAPRSCRYRAELLLADLPPGEHEVIFMRTGCRTLRRRVRLEAGQTRRLTVTLRPDAHRGNVVRNADFRVQWLRPDTPDCWRQDGAGAWISDSFPLVPGQRYQVGFEVTLPRADGPLDPIGPPSALLRQSDDPRMTNSAASRVRWRGAEIVASAAYGRLELPPVWVPVSAWAAPRRE